MKSNGDSIGKLDKEYKQESDKKCKQLINKSPTTK